jgi:hypothetical protein
VRTALISEDQNDSLVLGVFIDRLLSRECEHQHQLTTQGFASVLKGAGQLAISAARGRASLIVVMIDCDHTQDHFSEPLPHSDCRLCELGRKLPAPHEIEKISNGESRLIAALSVRTLESWLAVAGQLPVPGSIHTYGKTRDERRDLKRIVYGDAAPLSPLLNKRGTELARAADLPLLEKTLKSFAAFATQVRQRADQNT